MIRDPVYREAVKHRQAAVEDSRLIRHAVLPVGKTFGEIPEVSQRPEKPPIGGPESEPPIALVARWRGVS